MNVPQRPHAWQVKRVPRKWRRGIAVDPRKGPGIGSPSTYTRVRRLLWAWWPWSAASIAAATNERWEAAVGLAAVALICYLITPAETSPRYGLVHEFDVASQDFLNTVTGSVRVPFVGGNRLDVLNNGDEFYPAMLEAIASATRSVTIEAYIYWAGDTGLAFSRALARKSRQGVPVKILLDAVGSATIGREILRILEEGHCQLAWYNPIRWYSLGRFNHRTHRKSLIIDGRVGFTGGAGIADQWTGHAESPAHWRDVQVRIEGPAVAPLQSGFAQNWLKTTGELVTGLDYYPPFDRRDGIALQTIMSSPETGSSAMRTIYYLAIVSARESIEIANPYFVPDEAAREVLIAAKRRGVRVRILVAGACNDAWVARNASTRLYGPLLEAGIEIREYNRTMLHQKVMVVDGRWVTVGTANFDNRSFAHNEESNICAYDPEVAARFRSDFDRDAAAAECVELNGWRRRGLYRRSAEIVASLLTEQA